jgi:hypothetical protein
MKKVCNMLCGKGWVRTQDLGYQAERYDHCATRPVPQAPTTISHAHPHVPGRRHISRIAAEQNQNRRLREAEVQLRLLRAAADDSTASAEALRQLAVSHEHEIARLHCEVTAPPEA